MEFGLQFGGIDWRQVRDFSRAAEELGYGLVTFPDHFIAEQPGGEFDPKTIVNEAMSLAVVAAEATKRIRVGHLVLCNLFRHPALTAQALAALDRVSEGRAIAGLGSGWTEREFRMMGIPFPDVSTRLRMLDEALEAIRSLWTKERTTLAGEFYRFEDAVLFPKPVQKPHPPILVGGSGRGLLRIAARHADRVNVIADVGRAGTIRIDEVSRLTDELFRQKVTFLREEAKRAGRDPASVRVSCACFQVQLTGSAAETRRVAESIAPVFGGSAEGALRSPLVLVGTPEECAAEIGRRRKEWGAEQFFFALSDETAIRRLYEEVLVHV